jgi:hypothetical protein
MHPKELNTRDIQMPDPVGFTGMKKMAGVDLRAFKPVLPFPLLRLLWRLLSQKTPGRGGSILMIAGQERRR